MTGIGLFLTDGNFFNLLSVYLCSLVQKVIAVILFIVFLLQAFSQGFYCLDYIFRKKAYMAKCINKSRPLLHCDGKCLLMTRIREQEKKEAQQAPEMKIAKQELVAFQPSSTIDAPFFQTYHRVIYPPGVAKSPVKRSYSIFHPPCTLS
ncbi:hypothetical protein NIASO_19185 [Niabella soli DSM 19437]|uniref:Uncharacterized protein n=2 Tax=Niabella TaxID=379899 RepID=W0F5W8_9BACT|nr:hypothetical protein NIASO_19185 [Niabella soli DSM 19437]